MITQNILPIWLFFDIPVTDLNARGLPSFSAKPGEGVIFVIFRQGCLT